LTLGACCGLNVPAARAASPIPVRIRAASAIDDSATPFIYAIESGLFRRYGLDAELERATSGAAIVAGVVGGSFEIGKSNIISLCAAHARGLPITWIAPGGEYDSSLPPLIGVAVRAESTIKTGADLNGKTFGVSALNDYFSLAARAWTDAHGGDSSTIKLVEVPLSQSSAAVETGRIDAAILIQPYLQMASTAGKLRIIGDPSSAIGTRFMQVAWFTSNDFAAKNPETVDRFTRAMREASIYANAHHAETAAVLTKFMSDAATPNTSVPLGVRFNLPQIQALINLQARYKMIPTAFDAREVIFPSALRP
jgi:NitT/TauT family transport system substrate-binding protein